MTVDSVGIPWDDLYIAPVGIDVFDHFIVTYNPPDNFSYDHTVTVTVDAADGAGNAMTQEVYSFTTELEAGGFYGDVDLSGEVDAWDATLILRYTVDYPGTFSTPQGPVPYADVGDMPLADVDFSGEVDAWDATCILRYTVDYPGYENLPTEGHP